MSLDGKGALRRWLQRGDPAADGLEPDAGEIEIWRRLLLQSADKGQSGRRPPRFLLAAAAIAAAVLLLALLLLAETAPGPQPLRAAAPVAVNPAPLAAATAPVAVPTALPPGRRTVQFTTPGGVRVIWTLATAAGSPGL